AAKRARRTMRAASDDTETRRPRWREAAAGSAARCSASRAVELHLDRGAASERLVDDAIALGELEQRVELVRRRVGLDLEAQANRRKTDRRILGHAERAAKVEIAFGRYLAGLERDVERGRDRLERHAGAGDQRLQQHVAGTKFEPRAAGGGMQARDRERAPGLHLAGDVGIIERALGLQGDVGGLRVALVALLERRLHGAQRSGVHWKPPFRTAEDSGQTRRKSKPVVRGPAMKKSSVLCSGIWRHHHSPPPAAARVSPSSVTTARSSERSSAASTRRLTKSKAADWRSRGRGRSH